MVSKNAFISDLNGDNYFSIALLPDNSLSTLQEYADHAFAFIDDTQVSWSYDESAAILTSTFDITTDVKEGTESETLTALYRHQWINSSSVNTAYTYVSARGDMKVSKGSSFNTTLFNHGILPNLPIALNTTDESTLYNYINDESLATNIFAVTEDSYWIGKRLSRQSELIMLADEVGHVTARDIFINELKTEIEDWFKADNGETSRGYMYYNDEWNTLLAHPTSYGTDTNMNDHHFHYGYFIKAIAIIAQFDPAWASDPQWGAMAKLMIKDVNNWDRMDNDYPFLRYFDPFAGHSWANGHANSHFGNDQESSSEAINFAASVYLLGRNTHDDNLRDLGMYLYLTEISAIEQYWFDQDDAVFPNAYPYTSAVRVWGNGVQKIVGLEWYEQEAEYSLGINVLPVDGASLYLGKNPMAAQNEYNDLININGGVEDNLWDDIIWAYQALFDPASAISKYEAHTANGAYNTNLPFIPTVTGIYEPQSGNATSPAQLFSWLYGLDSLGIIDNSIYSNQSSSLVFIKNGTKHYVISLPPAPAGEADYITTVQFSDGMNLTANSGDLLVCKPYTFYADIDNDGFGDINNPIQGCETNPPIGYVDNDTDCDDSDNSFSTNCCDFPANTDAEILTINSAKITWDAVPNAIKYQVRYKQKGNNPWTVIGANNTSKVLNGLNKARYYDYKVRTECPTGFTPYSEQKSFHTSTCLPPDINSVSFSQYPDDDYRIDYAEVPGATKYQLRYRIVGTSSWSIIGDPAPPKKMPLQANSIYEFRLRAFCDDDSWSEFNATSAILNTTNFKESESSFTLSPNPAFDNINIKMDLVEASGVKIEVINIVGNIVKEEKMDTRKGLFNQDLRIHDLQDGIYFIRISKNNTIIGMDKFIKKKALF